MLYRPLPRGIHGLQMCKSSSGPFSLDITLLFSYFHSASPMFCTRHNILVLQCGIFDHVIALSWQESMNLIYYYFSSSPTLYLEFRLITATSF